MKGVSGWVEHANQMDANDTSLAAEVRRHKNDIRWFPSFETSEEYSYVG